MSGRLIAFGCSNTYGQGLKDCVSLKRKTNPGDSPSKFAWPSILAKNLDLECVNMSVPGASNKRIWYEIMHFKFYVTDVVCIMWTAKNRWCIINKDNIQDIGTWTKSKQAKRFYKSLYSETDQNLDLNMRISHTSNYLKENNLRHFQLMYKSEEYNPSHFNLRTDLINLDFSNYISRFPKAIDGLHGSEDTHFNFASDLYDTIKGKI
jgi:hypothetical protein